MSADGWRVTLPCTRAEAEAIDAADELVAEAVLTATEAEPGRWRLDTYLDAKPGPAVLATIRALAPSAAGTEPDVEPLADADWVAISQQGLEPIREGRFVVHTAAHPIDPPPGGRAFLIEAGRAFGTGHHATTGGCLAMLDALADRRFASVLDIGTGTGLLALAARVLWPEAAVLATDIDPVAIEVARANMAANGIERVELAVADGARALPGATGARFELVIANILAGPLTAMAPEIAGVAGPNATIVLSGLLATQAEGVIAAYAACGCRPEAREDRGEWSVLRLAASAEPFTPSTPPDPAERDGWALDL